MEKLKNLIVLKPYETNFVTIEAKTLPLSYVKSKNIFIKLGFKLFPTCKSVSNGRDVWRYDTEKQHWIEESNIFEKIQEKRELIRPQSPLKFTNEVELLNTMTTIFDLNWKLLQKDGWICECFYALRDNFGWEEEKANDLIKFYRNKLGCRNAV